jgi:four helix bundle protein
MEHEEITPDYGNSLQDPNLFAEGSGNYSLRSFTDLKCWQAARDLRIYVFELVKNFPSDEKYRLCDQMIRSSRSVTSQIAEGYGRFHFKEYMQYCRQSRGSLEELKDHSIAALDSQLINQETYNEIISMHETTLKLLNGYIKYLSSQLNK